MNLADFLNLAPSHQLALALLALVVPALALFAGIAAGRK